jgi:hypothetical protein
MGRSARAKVTPPVPGPAATRPAPSAARAATEAVDTDRVNYLNAGLMIVSAMLAFWTPFHLFLLAYAVLGPLHYFTEISWLHDRRYFAKDAESRRLWLGVVMVCIAGLTWCLYDNGPGRLVTVPWEAGLVYAAFLAAVAAAVAPSPRLMAILLAALAAAIPFVGESRVFLIVQSFLVTIIHVLVFTALFVLSGALKSRSRSGYLSLGVFGACVAVLLIPAASAAGADLSAYVRGAYHTFLGLNTYLMKVLGFGEPQSAEEIYASAAGLTVMRLIAFAYTYHYLNWFSKTRVIGWHAISRRRATTIVVLWIASVGLYAWNYALGMRLLYVASVLHVMLEFPLDQIAFVDIVKRLRGPRGPAAAAAQA